MLSFQMNGDILEVKETLFSFVDTKVSYWYYNIKLWTQSSHGKKDDPCDRSMSEEAKAWVITYYLPKVPNAKKLLSPTELQLFWNRGKVDKISTEN